MSSRGESKDYIMRIAITKQYYQFDENLTTQCSVCGGTESDTIKYYLRNIGQVFSVCSDCGIEVFHDEEVLRFTGELIPTSEDDECGFCSEKATNTLLLDDENVVHFCKYCFDYDHIERMVYAGEVF